VEGSRVDRKTVNGGQVAKPIERQEGRRWRPGSKADRKTGRQGMEAR
jgi:hypothetical protein